LSLIYLTKLNFLHFLSHFQSEPEHNRVFLMKLSHFTVIHQLFLNYNCFPTNQITKLFSRKIYLIKLIIDY